MKEADQSLKDLYTTGVSDGMEAALSLLLGRETGGVPGYSGPPIPEEAATWAMDSLAAIHKMKRERNAPHE